MFYLIIYHLIHPHNVPARQTVSPQGNQGAERVLDKPGGSHTQLASEPELLFLRPLSAGGAAQAVGQASPPPATGSTELGTATGQQWTLIHLLHTRGGTCSDSLFGQSFGCIGSRNSGGREDDTSRTSLLSLPHRGRTASILRVYEHPQLCWEVGKWPYCQQGWQSPSALPSWGSASPLGCGHKRAREPPAALHQSQPYFPRH